MARLTQLQTATSTKGPTKHTSKVNYLKPGAAYYSSNPNDYGTKSVTSTYAQGGIMGLAAGGKTSQNIAGGGSQDPNKMSSNMATSGTSAASATPATLTYDPKTMPAGAEGLTGAALKYYLDGTAAFQPLVDKQNADAAAAAAADASHQNGNGGVLGEWGNALSRSMGFNNSSNLLSGLANSLGFYNPGGGGGGQVVPGIDNPFSSGGGISLAKGGGVGSAGIASLPPAYLHGDGDAMSDSIPAYIDGQGKKPQEPIRVADGEYVVPGDAVSHLGNGSSNAGAKRLDKMVKGIRAARTGTVKQAPQVNVKKFLPA